MRRWIFLAWLAAGSAAAGGLVQVPAGEFAVTDGITSVPLTVRVSAFAIGATEVTQEEYAAVMGANPSTYPGARRPVESVSWWDAIRYCNRRSRKEGLAECYDTQSGARAAGCLGYRLPTDAEWRVAAGAAPKGAEAARSARMGDPSTKSMRVLTDALARGTGEVASLAPNALGIYDLRGNVWEWCEDWFDAVASPAAVEDPAGPRSGIARVIRGGSFVTTSSGWSRELRSSQPPETQSRYTGFRVARSLIRTDPGWGPPAGASFFATYGKIPAGYESGIGTLAPLVRPGEGMPDWQERAREIRNKWAAMLQMPEVPRGTPASRLVRAVDVGNFAGEMRELEMEPGSWEKVLVLRPARVAGKLPVLLVPFYDVDVPAGSDLGGRNFGRDRGVNAFAYTAAQHGYLAVAVRWFGESYGEGYSEAVANLAARHPGSTGLGKWVADARRLVDYVASLPEADTGRIAIMGHSLGGKMALYAAALDPRIRAAVASEPGIGFAFSNYEDYWYLGDALGRAPQGTDQHELLGLMAPRPFLLIGGDMFDKAESWHYIHAARHVYGLYGKADKVAYINHHTGHTPAPGAVAAAFAWLESQLR